MASKTVQLLLTENVDNLGIVGDVVNVRLGFARNYLLPMGLATEPDEQLLKDLADKRAEAEKAMASLRKQREELVEKMADLEITLERSCNDQGILYGSVTQQDLASALTLLGFAVKPREVRLPQTIKRVDTYDVTVKFDSDLEATVKVWVVADRELDLEEREEMEFDNEGNLIEKPKAAKPEAKAEDEAKPTEEKAEA
ncbi:MAG: 50S ribosomal protein L9 [Planctomycetota bacterium]